MGRSGRAIYASLVRRVAKPANLPRSARARSSRQPAARSGPAPRARRSVGHATAKPTIRAVAQRAGVSVSTVSRVLNGGYASAPVKARVHAAVRDLGYVPSTTARSLVTGRTGIIGVVVKSSQGPWFTQILGGIEEQLVSSRQSVLLASLALSGRYDASAVSAWIREHRVDGLIFARYTRRERPLLDGATKAGLPVVLIGPDIATRVGFAIRCENRKAGRLVGQHLLALGHRRIAFAGGPHDSLDTRDRLYGLGQAMKEDGLDLAGADVWFGDSYDPESGIAYAELLLRRDPAERPTAVVLGNDAMALGFMRTVLGHGLRIPKDLSVAGFDGIPDGALYWPGLTTVIQPTRTMGSTACRALLERIADPEQDRPVTVKYDVELAIRESTGAPPRRNAAR
jgi:DNA-binding LacI/PurR family transcriptional regulator